MSTYQQQEKKCWSLDDNAFKVSFSFTSIHSLYSNCVFDCLHLLMMMTLEEWKSCEENKRKHDQVWHQLHFNNNSRRQDHVQHKWPRKQNACFWFKILSRSWSYPSWKSQNNLFLSWEYMMGVKAISFTIFSFFPIMIVWWWEWMKIKVIQAKCLVKILRNRYYDSKTKSLV